MKVFSRQMYLRRSTNAPKRSRFIGKSSWKLVDWKIIEIIYKIFYVILHFRLVQVSFPIPTIRDKPTLQNQIHTKSCSCFPFQLLHHFVQFILISDFATFNWVCFDAYKTDEVPFEILVADTTVDESSASASKNYSKLQRYLPRMWKTKLSNHHYVENVGV